MAALCNSLFLIFIRLQSELSNMKRARSATEVKLHQKQQQTIQVKARISDTIRQLEAVQQEAESATSSRDETQATVAKKTQLIAILTAKEVLITEIC